MKEIRPVVKAIIVKDNKILLLQRNEEFSKGETFLDIPGGGMLFGESHEDAIFREIREEVNLDVNLTGIISNWSHMVDDELHLVGITFLAKYVSGDIKLSDEHKNYQWVNLNKINYVEVPKWLENEIQIAIKKYKII